jgi:hypothetical protein
MKKPILCIVLMILICACSGNHERDWPGSGSFYGNIDSGGECGVPAQNMFYVPAENREQFWYGIFLLA